MAETGRAQNVDPGLVAEIVRSYVAKNSVAVDQLGNLIATVQRALSSLGGDGPAPSPAPLTPAVPIRRSVRPDYVVCLECGWASPLEVEGLLGFPPGGGGFAGLPPWRWRVC